MFVKWDGSIKYWPLCKSFYCYFRTPSPIRSMLTVWQIEEKQKKNYQQCFFLRLPVVYRYLLWIDSMWLFDGEHWPYVTIVDYPWYTKLEKVIVAIFVPSFSSCFFQLLLINSYFFHWSWLCEAEFRSFWSFLILLDCTLHMISYPGAPLAETSRRKKLDSLLVNSPESPGPWLVLLYCKAYVCLSEAKM